MNQGRRRKVQKSIKEHLQTVLDAAGWNALSLEVILGYLDENPDVRAPVVAINIPTTTGLGYELGNGARRWIYFTDIEVKATTNIQLSDLMDGVKNNLDYVSIIDFDVAEAEDVGYDAVAQKEGSGYAAGPVTDKVLDEIDHQGQVSLRFHVDTPE